MCLPKPCRRRAVIHIMTRPAPRRNPCYDAPPRRNPYYDAPPRRNPYYDAPPRHNPSGRRGHFFLTVYVVFFLHVRLLLITPKKMFEIKIIYEYVYAQRCFVSYRRGDKTTFDQSIIDIYTAQSVTSCSVQFFVLQKKS